jgi:hypothetical protein
MPLEVRANILRKGVGVSYSARVLDPVYPSIPAWECAHDHETSEEAVGCGNDWLATRHPDQAALEADSREAMETSDGSESQFGSEPTRARYPSPSGRKGSSKATVIRVGVLILIAVLGAANLLWYWDDTTLNKRVDGLSHDLAAVKSQLAETQSQLDTAKLDAQHPTLGTWNVPGPISPDGYREGTVPDTFTFHLRLSADGPVFYVFLTLSEFARWHDCPSYVTGRRPSPSRQVGCVYWMFGPNPPMDRLGAGTNINFDFHYGEGCASWIVLLMPLNTGATVNVQPNVAVTYNPAPNPTPGCS